VKTLTLSNGEETYIDDADFALVGSISWSACKRYHCTYAINTKHGYLHRLVAAANKEHEVDHIDGNGLNNQRSNLRCATRSQNQHNRGKYSNNTSGFKGVTWMKTTGQWKASIKLNNKQFCLGSYKEPSEAYAAYCAGAEALHGNFARTVRQKEETTHMQYYELWQMHGELFTLPVPPVLVKKSSRRVIAAGSKDACEAAKRLMEMP
jgi:hypothetical protein